MVGPEFVFSGYTRRVARSVVDAMVPRWDDFEGELTDEVLDQVEAMVRGYPPGIQAGVLLMLYTMEFGGPLVHGGLRPLSWTGRRTVEKRLRRIGNHPIPQIRLLPQLLKIMVSFSAYSREDVEAYLGVERRRWREVRKTFRDRLVSIEEGRRDPPTPEPLVDPELVRPDEYLDFEVAERLRPATEVTDA